MKRYFLHLSMLLALLLTQSCKNGRISILPTSTGTPSEVLVVMENSVKKSLAGEAMISVLQSDVVGLPQAEPNFSVSSVDTDEFDSILKPVRNIIIIEVSDIYSTTKMSYARDLWAESQVVMYIKSPSENDLLQYILDNQQGIVDFFVNSELNRFVKLLQKSYNKGAKDSLMTQLGVAANVPGELKVMKQADDFFWISNNQYRSRQDFVVYTIPYTSLDQLEENSLIAIRDSVMRANIEGGVDSSYMTTSTYFTPAFREFSYNGQYCVQLKGLWEMHGDMMGGPFTSHALIDEVNQRIVVAEVFVYAPEEKKRNLMRRLEAALYTLVLPQQNILPEIPITVPLVKKP